MYNDVKKMCASSYHIETSIEKELNESVASAIDSGVAADNNKLYY